MKTVVLAFVVLAACGGKKDDKQAPAAKVDDKPADTATPANKPADPPPDKPKSKYPEQDLSHGKCVVKVSGAVTAEQTTGNTGSAVNIFQWHTEEMRQKIGYGKEGMILNCNHEHVRLSLTAGGKDRPFPMKPAKYEVNKKGGINVLGSVAHPDEPKGGLSILSSDGSIEITAFDDKHIAGKGSFTAKTLPNKGEVKIDVEFDFECYGLSGCKN